MSVDLYQYARDVVRYSLYAVYKFNTRILFWNGWLKWKRIFTYF